MQKADMNTKNETKRPLVSIRSASFFVVQLDIVTKYFIWRNNCVTLFMKISSNSYEAEWKTSHVNNFEQAVWSLPQDKLRPLDLDSEDTKAHYEANDRKS